MGRGAVIYGPHTYGEIQVVGRTRSLVLVGKYCSIGTGVTALIEDDHNFDNISTFPFGHPGMWISQQFKIDNRPNIYNKNRKLEINIGSDVWIGAMVTIFRGVTVGDGAVLGAMARVVKDIPPYAIVVGDSRVLRKRFSDEDIDFLLKLKWWDLDDKIVAEIVPILHSNDIGALRRWASDRLR